MHAMQRAVTAYGQASETLPPVQQVVRLYDGAMRRVREARAAIEAQRVAERHTAIAKAAAIVEGLQACLDHERGGEIAANLDRIYTHVCFRLHQLNLSGDLGICDELLERLAVLCASWAELATGGALASPAAAARSAARLTI
jgi:flagellar secretion chaperone FliS